MADSQNFGHSNFSTVDGSPLDRSSRGNNIKKSLVHSNVYSLRDCLSEFGEEFPNLMHLEAYKYPSKYNQSKVDVIAVFFFWNFSSL